MDYLAAATLLSVERLTYGWLWQQPSQFANFAKHAGWPGKEPEFVYFLVRSFKVVQLVVFSNWYLTTFGPSIPDISTFQMLVALAFVMFGQFLNAMVWYRIGINGVCYGCKFGRQIPWCTEFPYNTFDHPQYLGVILSIWGMFMLFWTADDWFVMPLIETSLYLSSMYFLEA